jgi:hypothetical protein
MAHMTASNVASAAAGGEVSRRAMANNAGIHATKKTSRA